MSIPNEIGAAIRARATACAPALIELRRDLHAHPELGFEEHRTAGRVAEALRGLGIPHVTGIGRTGVVGTIEGGGPGPTLAIRADMDALPIEERTGQSFASTIPGKMHACGHDIHTSTLLGVAETLQSLAPSLKGSIRLLFQPAEEMLGGAAAMIDDGALEGVDLALGFHNFPDLPVGQLGYVHGATLAASDRFDVVIHGASGHAAYPHSTIDPIVAAASFITQLQTIVAREIRPTEPCVVTVAAIEAGSAYNIIPDSCALRGTIRSLHATARESAERALRRFCAGLEVAFRVRCALDFVPGVPAVMNDEATLRRSVAALGTQFGTKALTECTPSMGAEDFALIAARVPSFHLRVGSGAPGRNDTLHSSDFQPDEGSIKLGIEALSRVAVELLGAQD